MSDTKTVEYHAKTLTTEMRIILRSLIIERDGLGCSRCSSVVGRLEFHHRQYNEFPVLDDLVLWCHSCHVEETVASRGFISRKGMTKAEIRKAQRREKKLSTV